MKEHEPRVLEAARKPRRRDTDPNHHQRVLERKLRIDQTKLGTEERKLKKLKEELETEERKSKILEGDLDRLESAIWQYHGAAGALTRALVYVLPIFPLLALIATNTSIVFILAYGAATLYLYATSKGNRIMRTISLGIARTLFR